MKVRALQLTLILVFVSCSHPFGISSQSIHSRPSWIFLAPACGTEIRADYIRFIPVGGEGGSDSTYLFSGNAKNNSCLL
jgi:hypothetical protein